QDLLLPEGIWFDYFDGSKYRGGQSVSIDAPLEKLPVLVRAGAFVPTVTTFKHASEYSNDVLYVDYFSDASVARSDYTMYDDDGEDPNSLRDRKYQTLTFDASHGNTLNLTTRLQGMYDGAPTIRRLIYRIHGLSENVESITVDGKKVSVSDNIDDLYQHDLAYRKDAVLYVSGRLQSRLDVRINLPRSNSIE
ncbi:MAG: DUF5110 domain-containing protein, partial [Pseudomonadota bacterium]